MLTLANGFRDLCLALISVLGFFWLLDGPTRLRLPLLDEHLYLVIAGLVTAAGLLSRPFGQRAGALEIVLGLLAIAMWSWGAWRYEEWLILGGYRDPSRWLTGLVALVLLIEAVRRHGGNAIAILIVLIAAYGFAGHLLPGVLEAQYTEPRRLIGFLFVDTNGVPGIVLGVASTVVLAFIFFSKCLEATGAGRFFDQLAMSLLGQYRGGPAKVAVASSSLFGMISGSSVANVVSSGSVTIPLMKRSGVKPEYAAAVEAVASNAGQLTPPVMGATAFLIAEFLQVPYSDVVVAAIVPAFVFYVVLLVQIDSHAARHRLRGLPRAELPRLLQVLRHGWPFAVPIGVLVYTMFVLGYSVSRAALYASAVMLALALLTRQPVRWRRLLHGLTVGVGQDMLAILLVSAGAGVVIGVLNISGLSFSITLLLTHVGESWGVLVMLVLTAGLAVVLGMGIPTAAVYVLLSVVLAPALTKIGLMPLAAHMFIFYFGLMSMLTPPVAIASYAAASIAGADLWRTSWQGLRLGFSGYLLPFVFVLNPALLWQDTLAAGLLAAGSVILSGAMLGWAAEGSLGARPMGAIARVVLLAGALLVGSSTVWLGAHSWWVLPISAAGAALVLALRRMARHPDVDGPADMPPVAAPPAGGVAGSRPA
ncbi:MAG: TRAP transporter fused permease subunit [Burkholderiaceae bacterium]